MIDLLLLGNGAMMPMPDRWLSALLMRCRGELTLFDCGEGTQVPWRLFGWGFRDVGAICLSHLHADHVGGLPGVLHSIANATREEPVLIVGPEGTADVVAGLLVICKEMPLPVVVRELHPGDLVALPGGAEARVIAGDHRVPSLIYRVDLPRGRRFVPERARAAGVPMPRWGELQKGHAVEVDGRRVDPEDVLGEERQGVAFGFMTDTRPVPEAGAFFNGVDLLVCEGTYGTVQDRDKAIMHKHMTFSEAATIARDAGAAQLWLTHFSPAMDDPTAFLHEALAVHRHTAIGVTGLTTTLLFPEEPGER